MVEQALPGIARQRAVASAAGGQAGVMERERERGREGAARLLLLLLMGEGGEGRGRGRGEWATCALSSVSRSLATRLDYSYSLCLPPAALASIQWLHIEIRS